MSLGIGSRGGGIGGGTTVTSTYLANYTLSVNAGFVCPTSGTKLKADAASVEGYKAILDDSRTAADTNIVIFDYDNLIATKTQAQLEQDLFELVANLSNLLRHNYNV